MSHDTTQASHAGGAITPGDGDPMYIRAERLAAGIEHAFIEVWRFLRFLTFIVFLALAILNFWLWVLSAALGLVRLLINALMVGLLWISGGTPPRSGPPAPNVTVAIQRDLDALWQSRLVAYENLARPLARHWVGAQHVMRMFWHWGAGRKATAVLFALLFIAMPAAYVIPRPNYVQVTDDNAVHYDEDGKVSYLIHTTDLETNGLTREYRNEDAWWLGKINSQGLKSQLQPGKNYKFWVVGIRWYYKPRMFPNIISAIEVDETGATIDRPSRLAAPPAPK